MRLRDQLELRNRRWYPWMFIGLAVPALVAIVIFTPSDRWFQYSLTALGFLGAFFGFLYAKHREETRLFTELFQAFNSRYNALNEHLNRIFENQTSESYELEDRNQLFDYFNLCAEEFLYYEAGYIDERVWRSWINGMAYFARSPKIRKLWEEELAQNSYYGFTMKELE